ncbi:MAG: hypothetical protein M0Q38_10925 [Bacteroidales bacterium]|jgi:hypothetical protein|nr:hypothetical protein [Bacteroidales bacterium]
MKTKIISITFLLLLIVTTGKAQNNAQTSSSRLFSIYSVSLITSWYKPSMNYWNNTFLPSAGSTDKFNGNLLFGGNITFNLPLHLGARVGVWYWQDKVNGGQDATFNSLRIGFTGFSLGAFYRYPKPVVYGISPYAGIEGSYFIIQNKYDVDGDVSKMSGYDISGMPFIGIERVFFQKLVIGLEYGYVLGRYRQDVETNEGSSNPKVSVNGHKMGITVGYKFP